ncbi:MAG: hypothetical protein NTW03_05280 [Verrucomicrobia bacterium]|nr:hypothetical protein [Verrucomicrobiota bacterium]
MNTRILKTIAVTTGVLGCSLALVLVLRPAPQAQTPFNTLAGVSVLELPQAAARLVASAPASQRASMAREVVQAVGALSKPGVTPFAVSAICRANPDVAAEVVGTAVRMQPAETLAIAKAAFTAAPAALEAIILAVCREVPQAYADVAVVAAEEFPASSPKILHAVAMGLPVLEPSLAQARIYSGDTPMRAVMIKTIQLVSKITTVRPLLTSLEALAYVNQTARTELAALDRDVRLPQPPPHINPPFTPKLGGGTEVGNNDATVVPPGTPRDYSAP